MQGEPRLTRLKSAQFRQKVDDTIALFLRYERVTVTLQFSELRFEHAFFSNDLYLLQTFYLKNRYETFMSISKTLEPFSEYV